MSQLITLGSQTNSNHHVPVGAQVNPKELDALIDKVSKAINWALLPSAASVKLSEYPLCSFVDEEGQDWEWDEPWDQTVANVSQNGVDIVFVHEHSGHELFFSYARETASLPKAEEKPLLESKNIGRADVKTLDDLALYIEGYNLEECITSVDDFNHIENALFQAAKATYFDTKKALKSHLEDEFFQDTPINDNRMAEHGWDGYFTIENVNAMLEGEGFEYGILHKSSFLSVDDALFHSLRSEFAKAHYALLETIGASHIVSTDIRPFVPM
jgi:hypothetical protein